MIFIMGCPLKELDTLALSAPPRRLIEGVLEVEEPTSADAGVASCLLLNAEPVFRCLRDDLLAGKIFEGMIRRGGNELPKRSVGNLSKTAELLWRRQNSSNNRTPPTARLGWTRSARRRKRELSNAKNF